MLQAPRVLWLSFSTILSWQPHCVFLSLVPFGLLPPASGTFITAMPLAITFESLLYYLFSSLWYLLCCLVG